jgi:hypothetical protein
MGRAMPLAPKLLSRPGRRFEASAARISEPCSRSIARIRGKSASRLVSRASPPLIPSNAGEINRSANSGPSRRAAKA